MRVTRRLDARVAAAAITAMLAAGGLAACGGGDDGDGGDPAVSDREQARATVERLYAAIAERVCAELNEAAAAQVAAGGDGSNPDQTCAESFQEFLDEADKADGGLALTSRAQIMRVKVDGDTAVARVRFGDRKGSPKGDIPLTKVDGEWKLEAVGGAPAQ